MKKKIIRLEPHQSGKVIGVLAGIFTFPFFLITLLFGLSALPDIGSESALQILFIILIPFMNAIFCYIVVAVFCILYNFTYPFIGGIELEITEQ